MDFGINEAMAFVEESSVEELRQLTKEELMDIMGTLGPVNFQEFLFAKNVKIFGGINGYVDDYFAKNTINKVKAQPNATKRATVAMLKKMLTYGNITDENKRKVATAIAELSPASAAAAAAAGKRKGRRTRRKNRK
jgi:hypothetical protein